MRILVIDDEVEVSDLLVDAVRRQGHEATAAFSGEEGLGLLDHFRPDAVFLDVRMPEMDGIEVLRRIRAVDPNLPVILITGQARPHEIEEARRLNVTDVVQKLYVVTHLREALERLNIGRITPPSD